MSETTFIPPVIEAGKPLGRLFKKDVRDRKFALSLNVDRLQLDPAKLPSQKTWNGGAILNQGDTSQCVGYSWTQFMQSAPRMTRLDKLNAFANSKAGPRDGSTFMEVLYNNAQRTDEWPGEGYDGTSVRAGAGILKSWGLISEYLWADTIDLLKNYVLLRGPVIMGTNWYTDMFTPDAYGFVTPTGRLAGGHAWTVIGYNSKKKAFRAIQSWGKEWGQNGRFSIKDTDLGLLLGQDGEACSAIETTF
jgi:papain like protease